MSKLNSFLEMGILSGILGIISEYFIGIEIPYFVLLILISIDTFTGMSKAIKYKRFSSRGLARISKKITTYSVAVLSVRLLEIGILSIYNTSLFSQILLAYLIIAETISILENLTLLGVPIPSNFIPYILGYIRLPFLNQALAKENKLTKYISEIEDIIKYQIPSIEDEDMRKITLINFESWIKVISEVDNLFKNRNYSNELIYTKLLSIIQLNTREAGHLIERENISNRLLESFNKRYNPKLNNLIARIYKISFSSDEIEDKKDQIIFSIMVALYQAIIEIRKEK